MTPSCTMRKQLPSEERGTTKQVREVRNTVIKTNNANSGFREPLLWLFSGLAKIKTIDFALFFATFSFLDRSEHQLPVN